MADFVIPDRSIDNPIYCPFCGGDPIVEINDDIYAVACPDCGALGPMSVDVANAINLWNHRLKSCERNNK